MKSYILSFLNVILLVFLCFSCNHNLQTPGESGRTGISLEEGFLNPPTEAKPAIYYLFINGYVNREYLGKELASLNEKGIGGLSVIDMGGRGNKDNLPVGGPSFLSDKWLDNFAVLLEHTSELDMNVQLCASSSWDMGGSWVTPEQASMALYNSTIRVDGPKHLSTELPIIEFPEKIPRDDHGDPVFQKEIALLAIPIDESQPAWEFVFKLPSPGIHTVDHVMLYTIDSESLDGSIKDQLNSNEFSVSISTTGHSETDFREILHDSFQPEGGPQRFNIDPVKARYIRLKIYYEHNSNMDNVQLSEFEVYSQEDRNILSIYKNGARLQDGAALIWSNSRRSYQGPRGTSKIHDGRYSKTSDSWMSDGPPPSQVKDKYAVIDLTDNVSEGRIDWDVPDGKWDIIRYVCGNTGELLKVPSPQSNGLATDHLSAEATHDYIKYVTDRLEERFGDLTKTALKQLYLPSYEVRGQLWTPNLVELFNTYLGYDITPYLPALSGYVIGSREETALFLYDFKKAMGDLLVDAYYRTASNAANEAGLGIEAESGGPGPPVHQVPVDALKALGAIDEIRGEFWPWRQERGQVWVVKETACAAHTYGKRRVHMEAFTGFRHWQDGPFELKSSADRAFCEGMNHVVWHTSAHQPPEAGNPGWVYHAGTHYNTNLIWYSKSKPFVDYLARSSFLLQQGLFVADVCYYYGDQGYNFVPPKHIDPSLGFGYDYDVVNAEVIINRMTVKDGRVTLPDGMCYELLVLPNRDDISLNVLKKIETLVKSGARVVGPKPVRATGLSNSEVDSKKVLELADRLWGDCDGVNVTENKYGQGLVMNGRKLKDILEERGVGPDLLITDKSQESNIDFIHRKTGSVDIYFVRNKSMDPCTIDASFRVTGRVPEIWDPKNSEIYDQIVYQNLPEGIQVPLTFNPMGSVFVVFQKSQGAEYIRKASSGVKVKSISGDMIEVTTCKNGDYSLETSGGKTIDLLFEDAIEPVSVDGPWKVDFKSGRGAPQSVEFEKLKSWSEHADPAIRYYSGTVAYKKNIDIPEEWVTDGTDVMLDLGKLWCVGEVFINGISAGIIWKPPYRVNIADLIKPGSNNVEIEVVNTWSNRLVGDALTGEKYGKTNIAVSGRVWKPWKDIPLNESGIFGPVNLIPSMKRTVHLHD